MKILGLSCGRRMGNSEVLLKEALMGVEEVCGAEVEVIRLHDLFIKPCTGCESCTESMLKGKEGKCILKNDHMPYLWDKLKESDGLILSAPSFSFTPPGNLVVLRDRLTRLYKHPNPRVGGLIVVGGSNWINLCLPLMAICDPHQTKLVDQMVVPFTPRPGQVVLNEWALSRARKLGRNLGRAINMPIDRVKYVGEAMKVSDAEAEYYSQIMEVPIDWVRYVVDEEETCPICHSNVLHVRGKFVRCAIDDVVGTVKINGDKITVTYDKKELQKARWTPIEHEWHYNIIQHGHRQYREKKPEISEKLKKYRDYGSIVPPPPLKGK